MDAVTAVRLADLAMDRDVEIWSNGADHVVVVVGGSRTFTYRGPSLRVVVARAWAGEPDDAN